MQDMILLFKKEPVESKKQKLVNKHHMKMTAELEGRMNVMCNLSEVLIEQGIEKGIEKGIEVFILDKIEDKVPEEVIIERLVTRFSLTKDEAQAYFEKYALQKV